MRGWLVVLLLIALTPTPPLGTAQPAEASDLYLPDTLVVAVGETLRIDPGTRVHGPGHIEVRGTLVAVGTPEAPIRFHAPIALHGNQSARIGHAMIERIPGAAITLVGGALDIQDTRFIANLAGVVVSGTGSPTLAIRNTTFEDHADTALRLGRVEHATVANATLKNNIMGLTIHLSASRETRLSITNSTFENQGDHLRVEVATQADPNGTIDVRHSRFIGPDGTLVVMGMSGDDGPAKPQIRLEGNRFESTDVAIRLEGTGYRFESRNDTFVHNLVGISSAEAALTLIGTRFDSLQRDLDLGPGAHLDAENVTLTPSSSAVQVGTTKVWPIFGGIALFIGIVALVAATLRPRPTTTPPPAGPADESTPPQDKTPPLPRATEMPRFTLMELRILHDIADHPDTAQSETAARLDVSRQSAHYHVKKLVAGGFVLKTDHGRTTACRLARHVRLPPLPPVVTQQGGVEKE